MNKVFKGIAYVLLAIFLIFLSLGLVFPKVNYETTVTVDKPLQEAFPLFNDIDRIGEWITDVKKVTPLKETADKVGSEYRMVVKNNGQKMEMLERVEAFVPNEEVKLFFDAGMMEKRDHYKFKEEAGKTVISTQHSVRGKSYYSRCMFALFKGAFQQVDQGYLDEFKQWAEQQ